MKLKDQSIHKEFKMPKLYRDDLESIEKVIKDELHPKQSKLETETYEYESVIEIPKDEKSPIEFKIITHDPYISIVFNKSSAYVCADSDITTRGAIEKIKEIIYPTERKFLYWVRNTSIKFAFIFLAIVPVFFLFLWLLLTVLKLPQSYTDTLSLLYSFANSEAVNIAAIVVIIIVILISYVISRMNFSEINFIFRKQKSSWLCRKKELIKSGSGLILSLLGIIKIIEYVRSCF